LLGSSLKSTYLRKINKSENLMLSIIHRLPFLGEFTALTIEAIFFETTEPNVIHDDIVG
jgi:hypothetical protein